MCPCLKVIDQEMYIVGETKQFPYWHTHMKLLLADVWKAYRGRLPDVDLVIHFDDWLAPNLDGEPSAQQSNPIDTDTRSWIVVWVMDFRAVSGKQG